MVDVSMTKPAAGPNNGNGTHFQVPVSGRYLLQMAFWAMSKMRFQVLLFWIAMGSGVGAKLLLPVLIKKLSDLASGDAQTIALVYNLGLIFLSIFVSQVILFRAANILSTSISCRFAEVIQNFLIRGPLFSRRYIRTSEAELGQAMQSVGELSILIGQFFCWQISETIILTLMSAAILFSYSPFFGLIFLFWAIAEAFLTLREAPILAAAGSQVANAKASKASLFSQILGNRFIALSTSRSAREAKSFAQRANMETIRRLSIEARMNRLKIEKGLLFALSTTLSMLLSLIEVRRGGMQVADLIVVSGVIYVFFDKLWTMTYGLGVFQTNWSSLRRAVEILCDMDAPELTDQQPVTPASLPSRGPSSITLNKVSFSYPERELLLKNLSLEVSAGALTAVVGPSGSGKSTLAAMLAGVIHPTSGVINVGGIARQARPINETLNGILYCPQQSELFRRTSFSNASYGVPDKLQHDLFRIAEALGIDHLLADPNCLGKGTNISGGQRSRLIFARAAVLAPTQNFVVMDEPDAALDEHSLVKMASVLERLRGSATIIVVTHRLQRYLDFDLTINIDGGQLGEQARVDVSSRRDQPMPANDEILG